MAAGNRKRRFAYKKRRSENTNFVVGVSGKVMLKPEVCGEGSADDFLALE